MVLEAELSEAAEIADVPPWMMEVRREKNEDRKMMFVVRDDGEVLMVLTGPASALFLSLTAHSRANYL